MWGDVCSARRSYALRVVGPPPRQAAARVSLFISTRGSVPVSCVDWVVPPGPRLTLYTSMSTCRCQVLMHRPDVEWDWEAKNMYIQTCPGCRDRAPCRAGARASARARAGGLPAGKPPSQPENAGHLCGSLRIAVRGCGYCGIEVSSRTTRCKSEDTILERDGFSEGDPLDALWTSSRSKQTRMRANDNECNQLASNTGMAVYLGPQRRGAGRPGMGVAALQLAAV